MARRRSKKRSHAGAGAAAIESKTQIPKSMVIRMGGKVKDRSRATLAQLTQDFRMVMEPHTASRLRERQKNRLRDFVAMAGPLGVSHLLLFSRPNATSSPNLRLACCPRGPTLHFRISSYSLCKDIRKSQRSPRSLKADFLAPPLLVMNNFHAKASSHDALLTSTFQHLFPPISTSKTSLSSIRRVLLLHKDPSDPNRIEIRHYAITTKSLGVSRQIRKLETIGKSGHGLPNLGSLVDISEYLLDEGANTSDSEVEEDSKVEVRQPEGKKMPTEQKAVKLIELGPRMTLDLVKIEEGICQGKILHHSFIQRTEEEKAALEKRHEEKKLERERRRREQAENVERKKKMRKSRSSQPGEEEDESDSDEMEEPIDPLDEVMEDDIDEESELEG